MNTGALKASDFSFRLGPQFIGWGQVPEQAYLHQFNLSGHIQICLPFVIIIQVDWRLDIALNIALPWSCVLPNSSKDGTDQCSAVRVHGDGGSMWTKS